MLLDGGRTGEELVALPLWRPKDTMSIAIFLFCGLVVGAVAQAIGGARGAGDWLVSMSLGVLGAVLGGFFGIALRLRDGQPAGIVMALAGAAMLVIFFHARVGRRPRAMS